MRRVCLLLLLCAQVTAHAAPYALNWPELIPEQAHSVIPQEPALHDEQAPAAAQPAPDAPIVPALNGQQVRIPGYIVPLESTADGRVVNFFLVPYYGACIHVPPPPANQIIYVQSAHPVAQEALWQPYWVQGTLYAERSASASVHAGYRLEAQQIRPYTLE